MVGEVQNLVQALQSPQARQEADQAARQVHQRLPELIDYLAHQRLTGHQAPVTAVLASHEAVRRPGKVRPERWDAFLEDLLHHTGLLVHHADGLGFHHETFLEYHAARHATRDQQARTQLLDSLFPPRQEPQAPALEPSYLGFLLDALLASPGGIAAETNNRIEALTSQGGTSACDFLIKQVALRTRLPTKPTASQLTRFAQHKALDGFARVRAAECLTGVEGYRNAGADRLIAFADDPTLGINDREQAVWILSRVDGYRDRADQFFAQIVGDRTLAVFSRRRLVRQLAQEDGYQDCAARLFARLCDDPAFGDYNRLQAAEYMAGVNGYEELAARLLSPFVDSPSGNASFCVRAARALARMDGYREPATRLLSAFADGTDLSVSARIQAAQGLAGVDGYRAEGADRLIALANDAGLSISARVSAAGELGRVGDRSRADQILDQLADDPAGRALALSYMSRPARNRRRRY
ncbi:hypothetical protein ACIQPQ_10800 [Streptomyces sp. NPDC091281]|uniref:hypothetical protein n=1 Tax=Streptomyces sp. NPDC091281 TaxID=3365985 RepID=UPI003803EE32